MYCKHVFAAEIGQAIAGVALASGASEAFGRASLSPTAVDGVIFGVETFSFHDLPPAGDPSLIVTLIQDMKAVGIAECEIMSGHVEPMGSYATGWWVATRRAAGYAEMREKARLFRLQVPMDYYRNIRRSFEQAGVRLFLYT